MDKKVFIPKVKFELAPLRLEASLLKDFSKGSWNNVLFRVYPELKSLLKKEDTYSDSLRICFNFASSQIGAHRNEIIKARKEIQRDWDKVSEVFLLGLVNSFNTGWPKDKKVITGYISIMPVYPRFLDEYSFCVGYRNPKKMLEVIAHEILHFLWFKKWKEVFPETKRSEYERPNLAWKLSEIMDPIILQHNRKIKKLIKPVMWGYKSFEKMKIGKVRITKYFSKVYLDSIEFGDSFEETLAKLWNEAKKHEKLLNF